MATLDYDDLPPLTDARVASALERIAAALEKIAESQD